MNDEIMLTTQLDNNNNSTNNIRMNDNHNSFSCDNDDDDDVDEAAFAISILLSRTSSIIHPRQTRTTIRLPPIRSNGSVSLSVDCSRPTKRQKIMFV